MFLRNLKKKKMRLYLEGYRSHNKALASQLTDAAYYYVYRLLGGRMARHITLDLKLTKELKKKEQAYGYCHIVGDLDKPRDFMIEIDSSMRHQFSDMLIWLAHETVHLKQFVRGELFDYAVGGKVQWKTRTYQRGVLYDNMPWEREAYRLEEPLYNEFVELYNV